MQDEMSNHEYHSTDHRAQNDIQQGFPAFLPRTPLGQFRSKKFFGRFLRKNRALNIVEYKKDHRTKKVVKQSKKIFLI